MSPAGTRLPMCSQQPGLWPLPSPEAGLGLIPTLAWGSPSQPTRQVWVPHPSIRHSKVQPSGCFSLPHFGYSHYQPICEIYLPQGRGQGRAGLADRRMAHFILPILPGHLPAMSGLLGLTSALNSPTNKATPSHSRQPRKSKEGFL